MNNHTGLKKYNNFRCTTNRLNKIGLLGPYQRCVDKKNLLLVDLSDNTNHLLGDLSHYPNVYYPQIKETFLKYVLPNINGGKSCSLTEENILPTNGVVSAIDTIIKVFCNQDSLVVTFSPSFPAYEYLINLYNIKHHRAKLIGNDLNQINVDEIVNLQPTIVIFCDPNNPIGSSVNDSEIESLLTLCPNTLFIFDETYQEYSRKLTNLTKLHERDNIIVLRNFSKGWGLASLRIGALVSTGEIISSLMRCIIPFPISALSEKEFSYNVRQNLQNIKKSWSITIAEREYVINQLLSLNIVQKIYPSDANFLCLVLNIKIDLETEIKNYGLQIEKINSMDEHTYRITIGTKLENRYFLSFIKSIANDTKQFPKPEVVAAQT